MHNMPTLPTSIWIEQLPDSTDDQPHLQLTFQETDGATHYISELVVDKLLEKCKADLLHYYSTGYVPEDSIWDMPTLPEAPGHD